MKDLRRHWILLLAVLTGTFGLLGFMGREVYRQAPPIPERVVSESGAVVTTAEEILDGQQVWQSMGGQQVGSIWGHGAYQAYASVSNGLWYARSAELLQLPLLQNLRWLRIVGDVVFAGGVGALVWFVAGLWTGHSYVRSEAEEAVDGAAAGATAA